MTDAAPALDDAPADRRPLIALVVATGLSMIGSALTTVALPWFVLETTGSAGRAGLVGASALLPLFVLGILGGALVDRLGFKRVAVISDLVGGAAILAIPLLYRGPGLAFWQLLMLVFLGNALTIPAVSARRSLLPELADRAGVRLERVNTAYESNQQIASLLGPPIAGLLIAAMGASNVLFLDAASFLISAAIVTLLIPTIAANIVPRPQRYVDGVKEGLRFLRRDRVLFAMAVGLTLTNFIGNPLFSVMLPVYANRELHSARALGFLFSALGIGALFGTLAYGWRGYRFSRRKIWLTAYLAGPFMFWALLARPSVWVVVGVLVVVEFLGGPANPLGVTIRHERIPPELRGRVFSAFSAVAMASSPLGIALAGQAIDRIGFNPTVLAFGIAYQIVALAFCLLPAFRELDRPVAHPT